METPQFELHMCPFDASNFTFNKARHFISSFYFRATKINHTTPETVLCKKNEARFQRRSNARVYRQMGHYLPFIFGADPLTTLPLLSAECYTFAGPPKKKSF
ncbi:hypothetical protein CDAR_520181 [Caerostris darwini]|uniref:Uncharacterized protein n=1 Tax=Caerostris darwini TaxID=1538125 RepID=A0AAV4TVX0_9ARAC|nr:hypothetical protein CDAR_520181 [Caerostris darwini]